MDTQSFWVHGSSAQMGREGYFISKERDGRGAIFKTHGKEWFHFAVPTPVLVDGRRLFLTNIFLLYGTLGTSKITAIHLFDGSYKFKAFDKLDKCGDHFESVDEDNKWIIRPPKMMKFALGLSVEVDFGPPSIFGVPSIMFAAAGANFQKNVVR